MIYKVALLSLLAGLLLACSDSVTGPQASSPDLEIDNARKADAPKLLQWYLPKQLLEVSGLALVNDNEVLAIQDERAKIFRLNIQSGEVLGSFSLGKPAAKGDFEGVAILKQIAYLLTSKGKLYKAALAANDASSSYEVFDLGLSKDCELEGLAHEPGTDLLWLVCKEVYSLPKDDGLRLHAWSVSTQTLVPELTRQLSIGQGDAFNPSGLAFTADGQRLLIIAARQSSYAWYAWSSNPSLVNRGKLPARGKHRQAEGVAITSQGLLLIADEGKKRPGVLSLYSELLN